MSDKPLQLEDFWNIVKLLSDDAKRCAEGLEATPEDDEEARSFWRRMYARAVFAVIDGSTYRMMFQAYEARGREDVTFSIDELTKLKRLYDFDEDREPVTIFNKHQNLEDIKFAFNAFARVHYSDYVLPINDPDWAFMKEIMHLREVLQYPKEPGDLEVYEMNVDELAEGLMWFVSRMAELLEDCRKHIEEKFASSDSDEDEIIM